MSWQTLVVDTVAQHAEDLSEALLEFGALSVDLLDADAGTPDEQAIFGEPGEPPPGVWQHNRVSALFDDHQDVPSILLKAAHSVGLQQLPVYRIETLDEQDWVRLTQAQFDAIRISGRLWIVPSWNMPGDPDAVNIVLDPGLAFGTGSHPTTRLCLRWLDNHLKGGESVLDYGCGSGILAIAALKLGAASAVGVDIDPQAVISSRDNAAANQVANVRFCQSDGVKQGSGTETLSGRQYDVVIANILRNPLRMLAPLLAGATRQGGQIVLSGILEEQVQEMTGIYRQWFDMHPAVIEDGWACLSGRKR